MYKIQIIDVFTKEVLMEEERENLEFISELFRSCHHSDVIDCFITDSHNRTLGGKYVSHSIIRNGRDDFVYQLFFKTREEYIRL